MPELYGDLVSGLTFSAALPLFIYKAVEAYHNSHELIWSSGPSVVCSALSVAAPCGLISWWYRNKTTCYIGYVAMTIFSAAVCYFEFPLAERRALLYHFIWHVFMMSANIALSLFAKAVMLCMAITWALAVSYASPAYTMKKNAPIILGAGALCVIVHLGVLFSFAKDGKIDFFQSALLKRRDASRLSVLSWKTVRDHLATLVVLGAFIYFMAAEVHGIMLRDGYGIDGIQNLFVAAFFGSMGLLAAGTLREHVDVKETKKRSEQFAKGAASTLQMATMALNASHTALAIADRHRCIMIFNPAFQRMCGHTVSERDILGHVLEDTLRLSVADSAFLVMHCFGQMGGEAEFFIRGRIVLIRVSPASSDMEASLGANLQDQGGYVLVLKDITEERALERAIESAQQQASMTQAIMNAIAALTQRAIPPPQANPFLAGVVAGAAPNVIPDTTCGAREVRLNF